VIRISTARRIADVFWPAFEERNGAVLLRGTRITSPPEEFESLAAFERFFSHTHLFDEFRHDIPLIYDQESDSESPDPTHPEFVTAWELAQRIGQMWLAKLERDFPRTSVSYLHHEASRSDHPFPSGASRRAAVDLRLCCER